MTTLTKAIIGASVAGLAVLGLQAIPAFAQNRDQATTSTTTNNHNQSVAHPASGKTLAQAQARPTAAQMNQMRQQCNSMMSMMQKMHDMPGRRNMPGMTNNQNSQSGQDRMNHTVGQ